MVSGKWWFSPLFAISLFANRALIRGVNIDPPLRLSGRPGTLVFVAPHAYVLAEFKVSAS